MAPTSILLLTRVCIPFFLLVLHSAAAYVGGATISSTILVIARDESAAENGAAAGLRGYGIPFEIVTVPRTGISALPDLNMSATYGNYGGIVILSEVGYNYDNRYYSALTQTQWDSLMAYQTQFGVRMVRLDVFPTAEFGVVISSNGSNLNDEPVVFTNTTSFPTANLKLNAPLSIANIFHYPASIKNSSIAWEVARFTNSGTAAVINQIGSRKQMVWFMPFALDWAASSNVLQHSWIAWITRGLYLGFRRIYLSTQVDDMFLETNMYRPQGQKYRCMPDDLSMHVDWQTRINAEMNEGSNFFLEIGHNGNGNIANAVVTSVGLRICKSRTGIERVEHFTSNPDFVKPLGTGTDTWPSTPVQYSWNIECAEADKLENWFADVANRDAFAHVSHTFSHPVLTNATYSDAVKEITFNQAWLKQVGLDTAKRWSPNGLIPPAITGLHNGDAIRAWLENGITNVVGDNTHPLLRNQNSFWPLNTTEAVNGYAGVSITPRWATTIYYNCDLPACTLQEWIDTSGGKGTFKDLLIQAKNTAIRNLMGLHWDAYMFHQANMRVHDVPSTTVGNKQGQFSLLMTWVETIVTELLKYTTWPIKSLKHDDLAQAFLNRQARDLCMPSMTWTTSVNGDSIEAVDLYTTIGNTCSTPIPITVPTDIFSGAGATNEQLGSDPLTLWVNIAGAPRNYKF
ncbi:hypothetical protein GQ44DRAFT_832799, partial [Phaeosphaeriaceae sp. PMI808]